MKHTTTGSTTDVLVVGAGIVGLAFALQAAQRGLRVTVVERDAACTGASIRNFGFVTVTGQGAGDTWQRARRSRDIWADIAPRAGIPVLHRGLLLPVRRPVALPVLEAFMQTPMAEGCRLHDAAALHGGPLVRHEALRLDGVLAVLESPHELRVESRVAVPRLAAWLAEEHGVQFRWGEEVLEVAAPRVRTSRATLHTERVVVCPGAGLNGLFATELAAHELQLCQLQMLRVRPHKGFRLPAAVMGELSLVRYRGYAELPQAGALADVLQHEEAASLHHGIHLIAVQSEDGTLVVGDSHHYGAAPSPFALDEVDALILRHLRRTLDLREAQVVERWTGMYPVSMQHDALLLAPDTATRVAVVTSGTGASTAFALAEDAFRDW
ncbi:MAG: TIGR03364 family FAD-dependent oxidoreductase [Betaproteobacteria bacterium]|nr:TIGR03364 family FAD-dependent oxidoreductase [Betaproteobacteria bacterium]